MELSGAAAVKYWQGARTDFSSSVICVPSAVAPFSQSPGRGERLSHLLNAYTCQAWHLPKAPSVPYLQVNNRLGPGECSTPWPCPLSSQRVVARSWPPCPLAPSLSLHLSEPFSSAKHIGRFCACPPHGAHLSAMSREGIWTPRTMPQPKTYGNVDNVCEHSDCHNLRDATGI